MMRDLDRDRDHVDVRLGHQRLVVLKHCLNPERFPCGTRRLGAVCAQGPDLVVRKRLQGWDVGGCRPTSGGADADDPDAQLRWCCGHPWPAAMACTANSIRADLPTSSPPVSRATFQVRPKSSRLTSVAALKPMRSSPMGEAPPPSNSTWSVTGFVVPCTVRSPASSQVSSPRSFTPVDANVIVG